MAVLTTDKFQNLVDNTFKTEDCWIYYGPKVCEPRRNSRTAWEYYFGEIPKEKCVLHTCDNQFCVNPNHLFLGSHKDNTHDMLDKNRGMVGKKWKQSKETIEKIKIITTERMKDFKLRRHLSEKTRLANIERKACGGYHRWKKSPEARRLQSEINKIRWEKWRQQKIHN